MHPRNVTGIEPVENEPSDAEAEENRENSPERRNVPVLERIWIRLSFAKYLFVALLFPPIMNLSALRGERVSLFPSQGNLVNMGWKQKMFIKCMGEGSPTVILDAPTGGTSDYWYMVQKKLAEFTPVSVCVYDRAGLGFSDLPNFKFENKNKKSENRKFVSEIATVEQMTDDLHHLVTVAKPLARPFILVGSEIGGLIARHYALTYPEDVHDIVLINPFVEDLFWRQKEEWNKFWNGQMLPSLQSLQFSAQLGISRIAALIGHLKPDISGDSVPKEVELSQLSHMCNGQHIGAVLQEYHLLNTSFSQMSELWKAKPFPKNVSVTVINSRSYDKFPSKLMEAWKQSQLYLRQSLHPTCKHYVAEGTGLQIFTEPHIVVNLVQQIALRWQIAHNTLPTVHTYREQEVQAE